MHSLQLYTSPAVLCIPYISIHPLQLNAFPTALYIPCSSINQLYNSLQLKTFPTLYTSHAAQCIPYSSVYPLQLCKSALYIPCSSMHPLPHTGPYQHRWFCRETGGSQADRYSWSYPAGSCIPRSNRRQRSLHTHSHLKGKIKFRCQQARHISKYCNHTFTWKAHICFPNLKMRRKKKRSKLYKI